MRWLERLICATTLAKAAPGNTGGSFMPFTGLDIIIPVLVILVLLVLAATPAAWAQQPAPRLPTHLHPALVLRDASGAAVLRTGQPLSLRETCGTCHDTDYIVRHATHEAPDVSENCLLCHTPAPNDAARRQALAGGQALDGALEALLLAQPRGVEAEAGQALAQPADGEGLRARRPVQVPDLGPGELTFRPESPLRPVRARAESLPAMSRVIR